MGGIKISDSCGIKRIEKEVRCEGLNSKGKKCGHLLNKVTIIVCFPGMSTASTVSAFFPGLEIKLMTETKCRHCKEFSNTFDLV